MNIPPGAPQSPRQPNPQIRMATQLVIQVTRDLESLLPRALQEGSVTVREGRLHRWQSSLQSAVMQLTQIPVIMIYPPPRFVRFIRGAVEQINRALATMAAIPIATLRIYPPRPGRAMISLQTLQSMLGDLQAAIHLLYRALESA